MLLSVVLHGALGERFGGPFRLDVASAAEAVRGLCYQIKGLRERLRQGHYRVVRVGGSGHDLDLGADALSLRLGTARELHLVPVVAGGGGGAAWKIVAGVALVAAAFAAPYLAPELFVGGSFLAGAAQAGVGIGLSLAAGGVSQLLTKAPTTQGGSDQRQSFLFGGQHNITGQGGPVWLVYGRFRTGAVMVSFGLAAEAANYTNG